MCSPHLGETSRELSPEEFIDGPGSALMYVIEQNAVLDELDINADEVSYTDPDYEAADEDLAADELEEDDSETATSVADSMDDEELDEWEGLYLCHWPNGGFSVVKAESKRDALIQLDEWAGGQAEWLVPLETFMADFRLDDSGEIDFKGFGEETADFIWNHCYPELRAVLTSSAIQSDPGEYSPAKKYVIKTALEHERTRLWDNQPEGSAAKTELGKRLQKTMGTTGPIADHYVEVAGKRILESQAGEDGKPN
jgi:hypothetical protein